MWDEGFMAQARTKTVQHGRKEVGAALQYAAGFHCLVEEWEDCEELMPEPKRKWIFVDKKREETKHRTEWLECGQRKMLEDRGALPKEDGDQPREYKAMHEENFLSSWPREDVEHTVEGRKNMNKEAREEESKSGKRERWREKR